MKIFGFNVFGWCALCQRRVLPRTRHLGHKIWACPRCMRLARAAGHAVKPVDEPIVFVGGPLAGAEISRWQGIPPRELYVVRGRDGFAATPPTGRTPSGSWPKVGRYAFDEGPLGAYRWYGWLDE